MVFPPGSFSTKEMVGACTGSLNVAVGATVVATAVALGAGVRPLRVGGVVSDAVPGLKTTSTQ